MNFRLLFENREEGSPFSIATGNLGIPCESRATRWGPELGNCPPVAASESQRGGPATRLASSAVVRQASVTLESCRGRRFRRPDRLS